MGRRVRCTPTTRSSWSMAHRRGRHAARPRSRPRPTGSRSRRARRTRTTDAELVFDAPRRGSSAAAIVESEIVARRVRRPTASVVGALGSPSGESALDARTAARVTRHRRQSGNAARPAATRPRRFGLTSRTTRCSARPATARTSPVEVRATEAASGRVRRVSTSRRATCGQRRLGASGSSWSFHPTDEQRPRRSTSPAYWRASRRQDDGPRDRATACHASRSRRGSSPRSWVDVSALGRNAYVARHPRRDLGSRRSPRSEPCWRALAEGDGSWSLHQRRAERRPRVRHGQPPARRRHAATPRRLRNRRADEGRPDGEVDGATPTGSDDLGRRPGRDDARSRPGAPTRPTIRRIASRRRRSASRRRASGAACVNGAVAPVTSVYARRGSERVYSLEVPGAHTFVTTGGLVMHNCFPKDVSALKQLAGNTGYALPAAGRRDRGQRAAEAPRRDPKLQRDLGGAARQADRAARPGLQAQHRRHARGVEPRAGRAPDRRGRRVIAYDPIAAERAPAAARCRASSSPAPCWRRCTTPTPR